MENDLEQKQMSTSNHSRPSTSNTSRTKALRDLLQSDTVEFLMGAHDGLSAKIVEGEGFRGIWGSGFSIAAAMGVRDCNEASWTQVVETCEQMCDATRVPILLDGDTGYGNFNNVMRLVRKCEQRGIEQHEPDLHGVPGDPGTVTVVVGTGAGATGGGRTTAGGQKGKRQQPDGRDEP